VYRSPVTTGSIALDYAEEGCARCIWYRSFSYCCAECCRLRILHILPDSFYGQIRIKWIWHIHDNPSSLEFAYSLDSSTYHQVSLDPQDSASTLTHSAISSDSSAQTLRYCRSFRQGNPTHSASPRSRLSCHPSRTSLGQYESSPSGFCVQACARF
jgi:hypothetical protein